MHLFWVPNVTPCDNSPGQVTEPSWRSAASKSSVRSVMVDSPIPQALLKGGQGFGEKMFQTIVEYHGMFDYTHISTYLIWWDIYIIIYKFKGFVLFPTPCLDFWPFPRCFVHFVPWNAIKISRQAIVYYVLKHAYYGIENLDVSTRKNSGCFKNQWWLISKSSCVVYTHILESRHPWWSWTCPSNLSFEVPRPISFSCITLW
jgi:hypothetical protein